MKTLGSLQLRLEFEDGSSRYLYQDCSNENPFNTLDFNYYTKLDSNSMFIKIRKPQTVRTGAGMMYGEPGLGISHNPWYTYGDYGLNIASPQSEQRQTLRNYVREIDQQEAYQRHITEHREYIRRSELDRRAAQAESDRRRVEEERNRTRTPWQRFRNIFD